MPVLVCFDVALSNLEPTACPHTTLVRSSMTQTVLRPRLPPRSTWPTWSGIVRRGWYYIVIGTLIGIGAAVAALSAMPPLYTASTRIVFERTVAKYLQNNRVIDGPSVDDNDTWGQIYIIASETNVLPVVRSLELAKDPEFNGARDETSLRERVRELVRDAVQYIRGSEPPAVVSGDPEKIALESVLRNLPSLVAMCPISSACRSARRIR